MKIFSFTPREEIFIGKKIPGFLSIWPKLAILGNVEVRILIPIEDITNYSFSLTENWCSVIEYFLICFI